MRAVVLALCLLSLSASLAQAKVLNVIASFSVLADVVREIGGPHVAVKSLVPPGGDPHEFEPSPDHARSLRGADVAFVSGAGLEPWFDRLARAAGYRGKPVVASAAIKPLEIVEDGKAVADPHVWNDPANVIAWTEVIRDALVAADPESAGEFRSRAERYVAQLMEADRYAHARIDPIPAERRQILTSHDAFGYFAKAYGVTFLAPVGLSTDTEPSAAVVAKLIDQIRREKIKVYFIESSTDARLVKQIGAATGATSGGTLFVESLSPPGGPADTYLAMLRTNVDKLADAMAK